MGGGKGNMMTGHTAEREEKKGEKMSVKQLGKKKPK